MNKFQDLNFVRTDLPCTDKTLVLSRPVS